jgi:tetratricopeptide (TPR) repeat protein
MSAQSHLLVALLRIAAAILFLPGSFAFASEGCTPSAELQARLKSHPASETFASAGNWFAEQKQFDCAAAAFGSASRLQPNSASLAYLWGLSLYSAGHDEMALAPLNQAKLLDANDIRPHLVLAAALDRLKRATEAEAEWRAALAIDPDSSAALDSFSQHLVDQKDYSAVIGLLDKPGSDRVRTPAQSLNLGVAYLGAAQLNSAANVLHDGLNNSPDSLPIADELAMVLMLQGQDKQAYGVLEAALGKHPDDEATELLYLRMLVSSHDQQAPQVARKLLAADPDQWEAQYLYGVLESQNGNFISARAYLQRSITLRSDYDQAHAELGSVLAQLGELAAAREHLEMAIALGDSEPEVAFNLAGVLQRLGETAKAEEEIKVYQRLKDEKSDKAQAAAKTEEGDQALKEGDGAKAAALYREAIATEPKQPLLYYKLSRALDKLNDLPAEQSALEQALSLNPALAEAQNQMGFLTARGGDTAKAEIYFRHAVHASPSYVGAWVNLAATLASEAKWEEARQAVGRALQIDPENAAARQLGVDLSEPHPAP